MPANELHLIAITDDPTVRDALLLAAGEDWRIFLVATAADLVSRVTPKTVVVVIDESAAGAGHLSLIRRLRRESPGAAVVVVGGPRSDEARRQEFEAGVDHYIERPVETRSLAAAFRHELRIAAIRAEVDLVGRSPAIRELLETVIQVGPTEVAVLIEGESGTGKDVIARAIHAASRRSEKAIEAINCGALAEGVLESELFGHEKGAFTGAVARRLGLFERANGGTVFLDEVGEMSPNMQVRLLRVLETGEVMRVGGVSVVQSDVRVIAATNRHLATDVRAGAFRQDLYYRLKGISVSVPPLRERPEDIAILAQHFLLAANRRHQKSVRAFDAAAMRALEAYPWPGNVRELRNMVDTLIVLSTSSRVTGELVQAQLARDADRPRDSFLPVALTRPRDDAERELLYGSILALHRDVREILNLLRDAPPSGPLHGLREVHAESAGADAPEMSLAQLERAAIQEALARSSGNRRQAAESLGISERTLYRKIKEFGLA